MKTLQTFYVTCKEPADIQVDDDTDPEVITLMERVGYLCRDCRKSVRGIVIENRPTKTEFRHTHPNQ